MNRSDSIKELSTALTKAQSMFPLVPKTKEVIVTGSRGSYTFKYAPLEQMISLIRPALTECGLSFTQGIQDDRLETVLMHTSGEWISFSIPTPDPGTSQAYGAVLTYRRRYSLKMILGIETDDDNSEEHGEKEASKKKGMLTRPITPTNDALDNISKERHEYINRVASTIVDCFNAGQQEEAYKSYSQVEDHEERIAVWSYLDSKMRRTLKAISEKERKGNGVSE